MRTRTKLMLSALIALSAAASGYSQMAPLPRHPAANFDISKLPPELQTLVQNWRENASTLRADARALREKLMNMTAEQRRRALEEFRANHATLIAEQRNLAKEIRAAMKELRQQRTGTG